MQLSLTPIEVLDQLRAGDKLRLDLTEHVNVKNISSDHLYVECISPALLAPTRVLTVLIDNLLWILSQKIMKLSMAKDLGIDKFFVSFAKVLSPSG